MDFQNLELPLDENGFIRSIPKLEAPYPSLDVKQKLTNIKEKQNPHIQKLAKPHIDSFNFAIGWGLAYAIQDLDPVEFEAPNGDRIKLKLLDAKIMKPLNTYILKNHRYNLLPAQCRMGKQSYVGEMELELLVEIKSKEIFLIKKNVGAIPIMVKSDMCHLKGLSPEQLIRLKEEPEEAGGYFIVGGNDRLLRMLLIQRANYPLVLERKVFRSKGANFSKYGIIVRSMKPDQTCVNNFIHFKLDNSFCFRFMIGNSFFVLSVHFLLKLLGCHNCFLMRKLQSFPNSPQGFSWLVRHLLEEELDHGIVSQEHAMVALIDSQDNIRQMLNLPPWSTAEEVVEFLFKNNILPHLTTNEAKIDFLLYCIHKLYCVVQGEAKPESVDQLLYQDLLTPGQIYLSVLKDRLKDWMMSCKNKILLHQKKAKGWEDSKFVWEEKMIRHAVGQSRKIGDDMVKLISTGKAIVRNYFSLPQKEGLSITLERINYLRVMAMLRSVHRGTFLADSKLVVPRLITPDQFGFLCPLNTPDGSLCGVLLHLAENCEVVTENVSNKPVIDFIKPYCQPEGDFTALVDGCVVGHLRKTDIEDLLCKMMRFKTTQQREFPFTMEYALVTKEPGLTDVYPGLYVFTKPGRLVRPVINIMTRKIEMIGPLQQTWRRIPHPDMQVPYVSAVEGHPLYYELDPRPTYSVLAKLIPFCNHNPATRNLYQCQMSKQSMGWPGNIKYRSDHTTYQINFPQTPLVRGTTYEKYDFDNYGIGVNAMVAIVSYTGYDMEDALVINRDSAQRGFMMGTIFKTYHFNLREKREDRMQQPHFEIDPLKKDMLLKYLDTDGLPAPGSAIKPNQPFCCYRTDIGGNYRVVLYEGVEGYIDDVKLVGDDSNFSNNAIIKVRIPRPVNIGDKFCCRHGQKGICSRLVPQEDMPFSQNGSVPDLLFNPNSFPSRMTVGLFIEALAGNIAAINGEAEHGNLMEQEVGKPVLTHYQEIFQKLGFNYDGTEMLVSGKTGKPMQVEAFTGVIFYQRLRHMVEDKYQCRSTGKMDPRTKQPVGGRKLKGGIKLGEMEKDALVSHGTSQLLQERMLYSSDVDVMPVCSRCGSTLNPHYIHPPWDEDQTDLRRDIWNKDCSNCEACRREILARYGMEANADTWAHMPEMPGVMSYLTANLAAAGIETKIHYQPTDEKPLQYIDNAKTLEFKNTTG